MENVIIDVPFRKINRKIMSSRRSLMKSAVTSSLAINPSLWVTFVQYFTTCRIDVAPSCWNFKSPDSRHFTVRFSKLFRYYFVITLHMVIICLMKINSLFLTSVISLKKYFETVKIGMKDVFILFLSK